MTEKPTLDTMKAELEAAGYKITSNLIVHKGAITWDTTWWTGTNAIKEAFTLLSEQQELARYRELGQQACDIPIGASIDQERIIDRMDEVYKLMTLPNITANDDESGDDS